MANKDNPIAGAKFEKMCHEYMTKHGVELVHSCSLKIRANKKYGYHKFDFVSKKANIIVECKSHAWTESGNTPSAKMAVWNEAMYYFSLLPKSHLKILFVKKSINKNNKKSLAEQYVISNEHLIPYNTVIWEFDVLKKKHKQIYPEQFQNSLPIVCNFPNC